jgi:hypothetical protein
MVNGCGKDVWENRRGKWCVFHACQFSSSAAGTVPLVALIKKPSQGSVFPLHQCWWSCRFVGRKGM